MTALSPSRRCAAMTDDAWLADLADVLGWNEDMTETVRVQVPGGEGRAVRVGAGQGVRIVDVAGGQVGDLFAFAAADPGEYASASHPRPAIRKLFPEPGDPVLSNRRRPILTV